jgi:hypothetical protein
MTKNLRFLLPVLCVAFATCYAQPSYYLQKVYDVGGYTICNEVIESSLGGYLMVGNTDGIGNGVYDGMLVKAAANGTAEWAVAFGGASDENAFSVQMTSDNNYIVTGNTYSYGVMMNHCDVFLTKVNSSGSIIWTKTYGRSNDDLGVKVLQSLDGGFIIVGYLLNVISSSYDGLIIKTNSTGDTLWTKRTGGAGYEQFFDVVEQTDGSLIIVGETTSYGAGGADVWVAKYTSAGALSWMKTYGGTNYDEGFAIGKTSDGGFIITGQTNSWGAGNLDAFLLKIDSAGTMQWLKTYGGTAADIGYSLKQATDNGYYLAGQTYNTSNSLADVLLIKTNLNGVVDWAKTIGGTDHDYAKSIKMTANGNLLLAGQTNNLLTWKGYYLLKSDNSLGFGCYENTFSPVVTTPAASSGTAIPTTYSGFTISNVNIGAVTGGAMHSICTSVSVNELLEQNAIRIFPNPAANHFTIEFNGKLDGTNGELQIVDLTGRVVLEQTIRNQKSEIMNRFSSGIYFVKIIHGKKVYTEKLVIE